VRQERDLKAFAKRAGHKIVGVFKETASGARKDHVERIKVMALARNHDIDAILVTELSRWGRSTQDLVQTLDDLHTLTVSVLAQTGLSFDLNTSSGKLMLRATASRAMVSRDQNNSMVGEAVSATFVAGVDAISRLVGVSSYPAPGIVRISTPWGATFCASCKS
jgi:DNA invertase Pin-like site-specific DNA recombinase